MANINKFVTQESMGSSVQTLDGKITTNTNNIATLNTTVSGHTTSINTISTKVDTLNPLESEYDSTTNKLTLSEGVEGGLAEQVAENTEAISTLNDDIADLKDVLEIHKNPTATANVSGATVVLDNIQFKSGYTYKCTWSIAEAVASPVYVYWYKSDGTRVTSKSIAIGETSTYYSLPITENYTGYLSANTGLGIDVTCTVESTEPTENAIERLDRRIDEFAPEAPTLETKVAYGFNIKDDAETGDGAYYWQSGQPYLNTSGSYGTDYKYFIFDVNPNSVYSVSIAPRWIILVDADGNKVSDTVTGKMINTGNAVKMYFTIYKSYLNQFAISEGYLANYANKRVIKNAPTDEYRNGNSLPMDTMYFSVGISEKLYYNNILPISEDKLSVITACNNQDSHDDVGIEINPISAFSNTDNAVRITQYDTNLNKVYSPQYSGIVIKNLSLNDCTALVIGDSTVGSWGTMTQAMLDFFTEHGKTLTLLGTRGQSATNKHEGRGGWSAYSYCREASHGDYTNPFLNNGVFDFSYYMQQQGYSVPDFVVIQLGINDVSNIDVDDFKTKSEQALAYEKEMIDSIRAYNSNIKIIINPPTTPNSNADKLSMYYETTVFRNFVIRYAMMLRRLATQYSNNNVRCSNNNLILDTRTEIRDNVHPTEAGFIKMGKEVCNQINCWQN